MDFNFTGALSPEEQSPIVETIGEGPASIAAQKLARKEVSRKGVWRPKLASSRNPSSRSWLREGSRSRRQESEG